VTEAVFNVVFVCTGNRFRSPLAAALMRRAADGIPVEISSVGTLDVGGVGALPEAEEAAARLGVDLADHRARQLTDQSLRDADLVVGFERMHVLAAVVDGGASRDSTFTLPELARLLDRIEPPAAGDAVARAREAVRRAARARSPEDPDLHAVPELADPLGLPPQRQAEIADLLRELTLQVRRGLFG
jgi:protein-tyrosine phosphatase